MGCVSMGYRHWPAPVTGLGAGTRKRDASTTKAARPLGHARAGPAGTPKRGCNEVPRASPRNVAQRLGVTRRSPTMPPEYRRHAAQLAPHKALVPGLERKPPHPARLAQAKTSPRGLAARAPHAATVVRQAQPPHGANALAIQRMEAAPTESKGALPQAQASVRVLVFDSSLEKGDPVFHCRFIAPSADERTYVCGASSIAELLKKLKLIGAPIGHLTLCGHGAEGILGMGSGTSGNYQKGKDIRGQSLEDIEAELNELAQLLAPGAFVLLVGCHVGAATSGRNLLKRLSRRLPGRLIFASEAYLQPYHKDDEFWINQVGFHNAKQGDELTRDQLVGACDGHLLEDVYGFLTQEDFFALARWSAGKKAKSH